MGPPRNSWTVWLSRRTFAPRIFESEVSCACISRQQVHVPPLPPERLRRHPPRRRTGHEVPDRRRGAHSLPRARRGRVRLRSVGWRRDADLRRPRRLQDQADPRPPRAGGHAHGRRLCARDRQAGRGAGDLWSRRHEHGDRPADGADGLGADDRAHRPDHLADARQGRLPGGGRHRHHLPGGEAFLPGEEPQRHPSHHA